MIAPLGVEAGDTATAMASPSQGSAKPGSLDIHRHARTLFARWKPIAPGTELRALPWHNGLFILFLASILAYGIFFAWYLLGRFDLLNVIRDVNVDDSFYYFQIARNLAAGHFSSFDGGITQTNGYHPLWLLLITPFYWSMDAETALFGIKGFEIVLIAGTVLLIATAARLAEQPWLLLFALPPLLYRNVILFMGLEAAAALFMLGLLFLTLALNAREPARLKWPLAAVAFALPWVRLEYVAISLTATAVWGAVSVWRPCSPRAIAPFLPFLAAVAGILVYFGYNWLVFGGPVPVSGAVKLAWSQNLWSSGKGNSLLGNLYDMLQIPIFRYPLFVAVEICVYAPLVWWLSRDAEDRRGRLLLALLVGAFSLGVGHIAQFVQTLLTQHPYFHGRYMWYFVPAHLLTTLIIPLRCFVVMYLIRRYVGSRWHRTAGLLSLSAAVLGGAALLVKADFAEPFRFVDRSSNSTAGNHFGWRRGVYVGTQVANRILPEGSVIGSWDAGVVAYFSRFPVVNLDGLVNSYEYFRATNGRHDIGQVRPLHRELGVTHLANIARAPEDFQNVLFEGAIDPIGRRFKISNALPSGIGGDAAASRLWEGLAPHFHYQRGDAGLMVVDRVALALARNCGPEELIAWSWNVPGEKPAFLPGNMGRGPGDLCVSEAVLPKAATSKSVRVEKLRGRDYLDRLRAESYPVVRSAYNVYLTENNLVYTKEPCAEDDPARFLLHLYPAAAWMKAGTPGLRVGFEKRGFHYWDFSFPQYGVRADGVCVVNVPLPGYAIARFRLGQFTEGRAAAHLWQEDIRPIPGAQSKALD